MTTHPNPYAAPVSRSPARRATAGSPLTYGYLASIIAAVAIRVFVPGHAPPIALPASYLVVMTTSIVLFCLWLRRAWTLLPDVQKGTSPANAVGYLFIPVYSLVWQFVSSQRLARGVGTLLARHSTGVRPPTFLAVLAPSLSSFCAVFLVVAVNLQKDAPTWFAYRVPFMLGTPFVWFLLMARIDGCFQEIALQERQRLTAADS